MENKPKVVMYCRVGSKEQLSTNPRRDILKNHLMDIPKIYKKDEYYQKLIKRGLI